MRPSCPGPRPPVPSLRSLQRAVTGVLLDAYGARDFGADPAGFAAARGVSASHRTSFAEGRERLLLYRELAQAGLRRPLEDAFPILRAHLRAEDAWGLCLRDFFHSRAVAGNYFRDVSRCFALWLAESGWGADLWPFLAELAHFELMELDLARGEDFPLPEGLDRDLDPGRRLHIAGPVQHAAYGHAVHAATVDHPVPEARPTLILGFRNGPGDALAVELDPQASAFLTLCLQGWILRRAARQAGLSETGALALLLDLREQGLELWSRVPQARPGSRPR